MKKRDGARIGILVPFTNTNLEPDMQLLAPDGVSIYSTRIGGYDDDQIPDEDQMAGLGAAKLDDPFAIASGRPARCYPLWLYLCDAGTWTGV